MNGNYKLPFYVKLAFTLISLIALCFIFYVGQNILIPVMMAFLVAIILRPIVACCTDRFRFPHVVAVASAVFLFVLLVLGLFTFISIQVSDIAGDFDKIEKNFMIHLQNLKDYVKDLFNLRTREEQAYVEDATKESMEAGKQMLGTTLLSFTDTLLNIVLIPIYTFLILLYRTHFMKFLAKLFRPEFHVTLVEILEKIKVSVKSYLVGLMIEMVAVSVMTSIGFMIIGLEYAILLGVLTGLLNLIPYIGIIIAGALSIIASMTTSPDLSLILGVLLVNLVVQLIDNNILVPMIVSSKVQINAMVTIVGIITGGALAGVAGMFLAIPIIAIAKVVFDRVPELSPWGYLMGDDLPKTYKWRRIKLPMYDFGHTSASAEIQVEIPPQPFTETNTSQPQTETTSTSTSTTATNENNIKGVNKPGE